MKKSLSCVLFSVVLGGTPYSFAMKSSSAGGLLSPEEGATTRASSLRSDKARSKPDRPVEYYCSGNCLERLFSGESAEFSGKSAEIDPLEIEGYCLEELFSGESAEFSGKSAEEEKGLDKRELKSTS